MLSQLICSVLDKHLKPFIKGIHSDTVKIALWRGDLRIENPIELRAEALNDLNLPVSIKRAYLKRCDIKIPWSKLQSESVKLSVQDVYVLVTPNEEWSLEAETTREKKLKRGRLEAEEVFQKIHETAASKFVGESKTSMLRKLIATSISNLQIHVENVHIRFEDSVSDPEHPFALGFTLASLDMVSTDENFNPAFVVVDTVPEVASVKKLLKVENFGVYCEVDDLFQSWVSMNSDDMIQKFSETICGPSGAGMGRYLLAPMGVNLKMSTRKFAQGSKNEPFLFLDVHVDELAVRMSANEYGSILQLVEFLTNSRVILRRRCRRPKVPILQGPRESRSSLRRGSSVGPNDEKPKHVPNPNARLWCQYVFQEVVDRVKERQMSFRLTASFLSERRRKKKRYIELRRKFLHDDWERGVPGALPMPFNAANSPLSQLKPNPFTVSMTAEEKKELQCLEDELSVDDILFYRQLANIPYKIWTLSDSPGANSPREPEPRWCGINPTQWCYAPNHSSPDREKYVNQPSPDRHQTPPASVILSQPVRTTPPPTSPPSPSTPTASLHLQTSFSPSSRTSSPLPRRSNHPDSLWSNTIQKVQTWITTPRSSRPLADADALPPHLRRNDSNSLVSPRLWDIPLSPTKSPFSSSKNLLMEPFDWPLKFLDTLPPAQKRDILDRITYGSEKPAPEEPKDDSTMLQLIVTLDQGTVTLERSISKYYDGDSSSRAVAGVTFEGARIEATALAFVKSFALSACLDDFQVEDLLPGAAFPKIISRGKSLADESALNSPGQRSPNDYLYVTMSPTRGASAQPSQAPTPTPEPKTKIFEVQVNYAPQDGPAWLHASINFNVAPLDIVLNPRWTMEVISVFDPPMPSAKHRAATPLTDSTKSDKQDGLGQALSIQQIYANILAQAMLAEMSKELRAIADKTVDVKACFGTLNVLFPQEPYPPPSSTALYSMAVLSASRIVIMTDTEDRKKPKPKTTSDSVHRRNFSRLRRPALLLDSFNDSLRTSRRNSHARRPSLADIAEKTKRLGREAKLKAAQGKGNYAYDRFLLDIDDVQVLSCHQSRDWRERRMTRNRKAYLVGSCGLRVHLSYCIDYDAAMLKVELHDPNARLSVRTLRILKTVFDSIQEACTVPPAPGTFHRTNVLPLDSIKRTSFDVTSVFSLLNWLSLYLGVEVEIPSVQLMLVDEPTRSKDHPTGGGLESPGGMPNLAQQTVPWLWLTLTETSFEGTYYGDYCMSDDVALEYGPKGLRQKLQLVAASLNINLSADYYNSVLAVWEPVLEPWHLLFRCQLHRALSAANLLGSVSSDGPNSRPRPQKQAQLHTGVIKSLKSFVAKRKGGGLIRKVLSQRHSTKAEDAESGLPVSPEGEIFTRSPPVNPTQTPAEFAATDSPETPAASDDKMKVQIRVDVTATGRLEVNTTPRLLDLALNALAEWKGRNRGVSDSDLGWDATDSPWERPDQPYVPYWLDNASGLRLKFCVVEDPMTSRSNTWAEPGTCIPVSVPQSHAVARNQFTSIGLSTVRGSQMGSEPGGFVSLRIFEEETWSDLACIPVDKEGVYVMPSPAMEADIVCHVVTKETTHRVLTVRSSVVIRNVTNVNLMLRLDSAEVLFRSKEYELKAGAELPVPIPVLRRGSISIRESEGVSKRWSVNPFSIRHVKSVESALLLNGQKPGSSSFCASLKIERLKRFVQLPGRQPTIPPCVIRIHAPLIIENLLPVRVQYRLSLDPFNDLAISFVEKGQKAAYMGAHPSQTPMFLSVRLGIDYDWSRPQEISGPAVQRLSLKAHLTPRESKQSFIRIMVDALLDGGNTDEMKLGPQHLVLYTPFWLINQTEGLLRIMQSGKQNHKERVLLPAKDHHGRGSYDEKLKIDSTLINMFSLKKPKAAGVIRDDKVRLGVSEGKWSSPFSLNTIKKYGSVSVPDHSKFPLGEYEIGVSIHTPMNRLHRTRIVTFTPRYVFVHQSGCHSLDVMQLDAPQTAVTLAPSQRVAFHGCKTKNLGPHLLRVRLVETPPWEWSAASAFDEIGVWHISVRRVRARDSTACNEKSFVRMNVQTERATTFVFFHELRVDEAPYRIDNCTDCPVMYEQRWASVLLPDTLLPGQKAYYAWECPAMEKRRLTIHIDHPEKKVVCKHYSLDSFKEHLHVDGVRHPIYVRIEPGDPTRVITITYASTNRAQVRRPALAIPDAFRSHSFTSFPAEPLLNALPISTSLPLSRKSTSHHGLESNSTKLLATPGHKTSSNHGLESAPSTSSAQGKRPKPSIKNLSIATPASPKSVTTNVPLTPAGPSKIQGVRFVERPSVSVLQNSSFRSVRSVSTNASSFTESEPSVLLHSPSHRYLRNQSSNHLSFSMRKPSVRHLGNVNLGKSIRLLPGKSFARSPSYRASRRDLHDGTRGMSFAQKRRVSVDSSDEEEEEEEEAPVEEEEEELEEVKVRVRVCIEGIGISVCDERPTELMYAVVDMINLNFVKTLENHQVCECEVQSFQIDNQLVTVPAPRFPVILAPSKTQLPIKPPLFVFRAVRVPNKNGKALLFDDVFVSVQPMDIRIEEDLVYRLLGLLIRYVGSRTDDVPTLDSYWLDRRPLPSEEIQVYIRRLVLGPMQFNLTFANSPVAPRLSELDSYRRIIPFLRVGLSFSIDHAPMRLRAFEGHHIFSAPGVLLQRIAQNYAWQVAQQATRILGSADGIASPVGMITSLGTGVWEFFYEPAMGLMTSPKQFLKGLAKGSGSLAKGTLLSTCSTFAALSTGCAKGAEFLSMDKGYRRSKNIRRYLERPRHVGHGLFLGVKNLSLGFYNGFVGIGKSPYKSVRQKGIKGLAAGVGIGLLGAVTKPVGGILDLFANTTGGLKTTVQSAGQRGHNFAEQERMRLPRTFGDGVVLQGFMEEEARTTNLFHKLTRGEFAAECVMHTEWVSERGVVFITNQRVFFAKCDSKNGVKSHWQVPLEEIRQAESVRVKRSRICHDDDEVSTSGSTWAVSISLRSTSKPRLIACCQQDIAAILLFKIQGIIHSHSRWIYY